MPFIIAVCGGSGSGKTFLAHALSYNLKHPVSILSYDSYYKDQSDLTPEERVKVNYDAPDSLDEELFKEQLSLIKQGKKVQVPQYDFAVHNRKKMAKAFMPKEIVIVEGILTLTVDTDLYDFTLYVDADDDVRLSRRILRDSRERGRSLPSIIEQYQKTVKPMHYAYVEPCKKKADYIFMNNGSNGLPSHALDELIEAIERKLSTL